MKQLRPGDRLMRGRQVRLIDQNNAQVGIVSFETAMARAQAAGLDLVLVPSKGDPQVTRIMDFGKYQYEESKRAREARRAQQQPKLKEVKLHVNIDSNDFAIKLRKAREFLSDGDKVRVLLTFRGREMAHKELGMDVLNRFLGELAEISTPDGPPRQLGKAVNVTLSVKPQFRKERTAKPEKPAREEKSSTEEAAAN
ncbi:MAG: translation initiation factor IF-3 [Victivallales bacterium]|nr:translation initiation factor IF-3 [Victivallales bacterium]